ncbi:MAG: FAD:protein FMN transferase [Candidatus Omnitrophica bacterium]|nr:FAD:protein FMN transferase [Candidatus Omnitrophota bacterium]
MKKPILFSTFILIIAFLVSVPLLIFTTRVHTELKMGTYVKVTLSGPRWLDFDSAFKAAFDAIDRVDDIADIYDKESQISKVNRQAGKRAVVVSEDLFTLIMDSVALSRDSNGAFDITVGPLVKLWSSYKKKGSAPPAHSIRRALSLVGYDDLVLDKSEKSVYFKKNGMSIDLSAIAKGYAVDYAAAEIKEKGFKSAIVNAGGDLYCLGRRPFLRKWRVGIADPRNRAKVARLLYLSDAGVASSGGSEQFFKYKGTYYTHLIHPQTGYPVEKRYFSVTVVAPTCMLADGLSTAIAVGGPATQVRFQSSYPKIEIITED